MGYGPVVSNARWCTDAYVSPDDYVVDEQRSVYKHLRLMRSTYGTWNTSAMRYYGQEIVTQQPAARIDEARECVYTRTQHALTAGFDDLHQMGGDIVLDTHAHIVYAYKSRTSTDRPPVCALLDECTN